MRSYYGACDKRVKGVCIRKGTHIFIYLSAHAILLLFPLKDEMHVRPEAHMHLPHH